METWYSQKVLGKTFVYFMDFPLSMAMLGSIYQVYYVFIHYRTEW